VAEPAAYDDWAPWYDVTDADRTPFVDFYGGLVGPTTRSLLELGCGTGTIGVALAQRMPDGARVAGVDESAGMLAVAARRAPAHQWVQGDMRRPPVEGPFDVVLCCFNTLQLLPTDDDLLLALQSARALLADDGRFAFDVYLPNVAYLKVPQENRLARAVRDADGRRLEIREDTTYDEDTRLLSIDWRLVAPADGPEPIARTSYALRQYPADILRDAVAAAGLDVVEAFGDLDRSPLTPASRKQVLVCRRG
jgi:trans-aconitate methyltransferase